MFLGSRQDKNNVSGRLFQRFQKRIECRCGEHVYLVDDEHLVFTNLRRYACLVHERFDVLHGVVTGSVKFKDIV